MNINVSKTITTTCLVIGGGMTSHIACYELSNDENIQVVMIRDGSGASPHISGFNIPRGEKEDSVECYIQDTLTSSRGHSDVKLVKTLCEKSYDLVEYLENLGFNFDRVDGELKSRKALGSSYKRVMGSGNTTGPKLLNILFNILKERKNVTILDSVRALSLLKSENKVNGALCYDKKNNEFVNIEAKATLLASGGFSRIYKFSSNTGDIGGDGLAMGLYAGCHASDLEFIQFEPSSAVYPDEVKGKGMITTLFYEGAIMTNGLGERFMLKYGEKAECQNKDVLAKAIAKEINEGRGTIHNGVYFDCTRVGRERMNDSYHLFIKRYEDVRIDLNETPVEVANGAHTSLGGLIVNENCESEVKGLFIAGEAMGRLHGANRIGGSAGAETLVFSQVAANAIKKNINSLEIEKYEAKEFSNNTNYTKEYLDSVKEKMEDTLDKYVNVIRNEEGLKKAVEILSSLYNEVKVLGVKNNELTYQRLRLENDLLSALSLAMSARLRTDSVGCHYRDDYEQEAKEIYRTDCSIVNNELKITKIN